MSRSRGSLRAVAGALFCLLSVAAHAQTGYTIQGLGGLGTDANRHVNSIGQALNSKGQVAGHALSYTANHTSRGGAAFLFRNGNIVNLGNFGTDSNGIGESSAYGINDSGLIVGYSQVYDAQHNHLGYAPFLWQNGKSLINLGGFGTASNGGILTSANGINAAGQVCGYSSVYDNQHNQIGTAAFLWQNGTLTNLGNFGTDNTGYSYSTANAINNLTQIVGYSYVYDAMHNSLGTAAFFLQPGQTLSNPANSLGNLGTSSANGPGYSYAKAINNLSQVVGYSELYDTNHNDLGWRAFFYDFVQTKTMTALPALGTAPNGITKAEADSINDKGQIVGYSMHYDSNGNYIEQDAVLWPTTTTIVNLNDYLPSGSGWQLTQAYGINNRGQITGFGMHNGAQEGFLLTPYEAGDFTRDGRPDILFQNSTTGDLGLAVMNGVTRQYSLAPALAVPLQWKVAATPDLNGDGYADIVWQNSQTGDLAYWLMNNGIVTGSGYIYYGLPLNWKVVASADFNGDGYTDLVLQDSQSGTIAIWYLTGTDYFDFGLIGTNPGTGWQVVGAGDVNGDGQPDLLLRSKANGDLYAWLLNGLTVSKGVLLGNVPLSWSLVGVGDFGGDGNASLLWQNANNDLYYWLMNGTTIASYGLIQSGVPNWQVVGPK